MALNSEYFDAINIDVVKKKYYNANKVNALLADIRQQAEEMYRENQEMKKQLELLNGHKAEIGDAVLAAQGIYRELVEKANLRADEIIEEAEARRSEILGEVYAQQEYAVNQVQSMVERMRKRQQESLDAINSEWQEFLCGLYPEEESTDYVPDDLGEKLGLIAKEMLAIGEE